MSIVLAGAAAPSVVSCPGLVNLTGSKSGMQGRYGEGSHVELLVMVSPAAMMMMQI